MKLTQEITRPDGRVRHHTFTVESGSRLQDWFFPNYRPGQLKSMELIYSDGETRRYFDPQP